MKHQLEKKYYHYPLPYFPKLSVPGSDCTNSKPNASGLKVQIAKK